MVIESNIKNILTSSLEHLQLISAPPGTKECLLIEASNIKIATYEVKASTKNIGGMEIKSYVRMTA